MEIASIVGVTVGQCSVLVCQYRGGCVSTASRRVYFQHALRQLIVQNGVYISPSLDILSTMFQLAPLSLRAKRLSIADSASVADGDKGKSQLHGAAQYEK